MIKQSMNDQPLPTLPETSVPIHQVILGGFGILSSGKSIGQPSSGGGCCGGSSCGC